MVERIADCATTECLAVLFPERISAPFTTFWGASILTLERVIDSPNSRQKTWEYLKTHTPTISQKQGDDQGSVKKDFRMRGPQDRKIESSRKGRGRKWGGGERETPSLLSPGSSFAGALTDAISYRVQRFLAWKPVGTDEMTDTPFPWAHHSP